MSRIIRNLAALAALALAPVAVHGQAIEEKNVLAGKATLDPALGYVFMTAPYRASAMFLRVPDDETRAAYQKDWDEAFAKALKKYPGQLERWKTDVTIAKATNKKPPEMPAEPDRETFSIGAIELRDMVGVGPMYVFSKAEARFSYLTGLKPGTYIYYGPIVYAPGTPVGGMCFCMGTVKFEVKAGVITDLGNSLLVAPRAVPPYDVNTQLAMRMIEERAAKGKEPALPMPELAFGLPETIKAWPSVQAELHASGKLNNYFAITISRMPPIPGVLDYRRDTVIDARTGQDVPNPPIVTQQKIKD